MSFHSAFPTAEVPPVGPALSEFVNPDLGYGTGAEDEPTQSDDFDGDILAPVPSRPRRARADQSEAVMPPSTVSVVPVM